jgi:hypothetical protein
MDKLTDKQAFQAMILFLDDYYARKSSDEIGAILGGLQMIGDGMPADPAAWDDWLKCVRQVLTYWVKQESKV